MICPDSVISSRVLWHIYHGWVSLSECWWHAWGIVGYQGMGRGKKIKTNNPSAGNRQHMFSMSPPFLPLSLLVTSPVDFFNRHGMNAFSTEKKWFQNRSFGKYFQAAVDMGFGLVDIACTQHVPGLTFAYLLGAETCGVLVTSFYPLYSPADAGLLWNKHSQAVLGAASQETCSNSTYSWSSSAFQPVSPSTIFTILVWSSLYPCSLEMVTEHLLCIRCVMVTGERVGNQTYPVLGTSLVRTESNKVFTHLGVLCAR